MYVLLHINGIGFSCCYANSIYTYLYSVPLLQLCALDRHAFRKPTNGFWLLLQDDEAHSRDAEAAVNELVAAVEEALGDDDVGSSGPDDLEMEHLEDAVVDILAEDAHGEMLDPVLKVWGIGLRTSARRCSD